MATAPSRPVDDAVSVPFESIAPTTGPRVSVVVPTYQGAESIGVCLDSLVNQTLDPKMFEIVVVQNGPPCGTPAVVDRVRHEFPRHTIRLLESTEPGAGRARNLGIDAARGAYVTFVDDDDWVSEGYLATLLAAARPGVVPVAYIGDVPEGSAPGEFPPDFDNYLSRKLLRVSGKTVPIDQIGVVVSANAAKLVPTALARAVRYDESLPSGEDFVFWIGVHARSQHAIHVTARELGAVYHRTVRRASVSRREPSHEFSVSQRLACVAALQRIPDQSPTTSKLVRWSTGGQAELIRDYLLTHPESADRVRTEAAELGIDDVLPWRQINRGLARDLAVLYCFTPFVDTSALVAARRLRDRDEIVDVIAQDMHNIREKDPSSMAVAAEFLDEVRILPGEAEFALWEPTTRFAANTLRAVRRLQEKKGPYRTLYSRAMAPQSHFAAALVKLHNPEIVWTAEFSDPLLINAYGQERAGEVVADEVVAELSAGIRRAGFALPATNQLFSWAEQLAYVLADHVVFTNPRQRDFMLGYCDNQPAAERAAGISSVSPHPTLPARFYRIEQVDHPLAPGKVHVAYFGQFYLTRGLDEITGALEALTPAERLRIRLHVFTDKPDKLELELLRRGLSDVVVARGYVPFLRFLNLTTQFDALVVNDAATAQHHEVNPYLPSKLSDYRGSGTPIWAIVEPGSVLSEQRVEHRSRLGDVEGATAVLRELIAAGPRDRDAPPG